VIDAVVIQAEVEAALIVSGPRIDPNPRPGQGRSHMPAFNMIVEQTIVDDLCERCQARGRFGGRKVVDGWRV
jgi:hypothetical protein